MQTSYRKFVVVVTMLKPHRNEMAGHAVSNDTKIIVSKDQKAELERIFEAQSYSEQRVEGYTKRGHVEDVFEALQNAAVSFEKTGDTWLADHFHKRCLETSVEIKNDGQRKEAEAHCNMGLSYEAKGTLSKAVIHFEHFYALSNGNEWYTLEGQNFGTIASDCLCRIYTTMAEELVDGNIRETIEYLLKAYEMAKAVDHKTEALASYRLGSAFESTGDSKTAIDYHKIYLEKCKHNEDDVGLGSACQALARSYESLGDLENAARYLEMYVEVADRIGEDEHVCQARNSLGVLYNTLGQFQKAVECFNTSYESAQKLGDKHTLAASRVRYGASTAHRFLAGYSGVVGNLEVGSLLTWKDSREQVSMIAVETDTAEIQARRTSSEQETVGDIQVDTEQRTDQ